jgi:uracil-DNA glycosylase family 4
LSEQNKVAESLRILRRGWEHCERCKLGAPARHHVLWDQLCFQRAGIVRREEQDYSYTDILIVGEGPGVGEDVLGKPFVGPSGKLLKEALTAAFPPQLPVTVTLTNLVACRPFSHLPTTSDNRAPSPEEIAACRPRVVDTIRTFRPRLIIAAGNVPHEYLPEMIKEAGLNDLNNYTHIRHPAWVIRQDDRQLALSVYIETIRVSMKKVGML